MGFTGGMITAGLVRDLRSFHAWGERIIGGIPWSIAKSLSELGGAKIPPKHQYMDNPWGSSITIDPELFKHVADLLLLESGVRMLLHTCAVDVVRKGPAVEGVVVENVDGRQTIRSRVVIDATGNGDVAARAGAIFRKGRRPDGKMQPVTLMFEIGSCRPDISLGRLQALLRKARKTGELENFIIPYPTGEELWLVNGKGNNVTRILDIDGTNAADLTAAEIMGRRQAFELLRFMRKHVPGCRKARITKLATQVGIRETRRIVGEYVLTKQDLLTGRNFQDEIARSFFFIDIHNPKGTGVIREYLSRGLVGHIPYRCLLPRKIGNLLVAGRCISGTHEALATCRVTATCMSVGEAAGVAAALCARGQLNPRQIDRSELLAVLETSRRKWQG